jgi:nucleoside-diphosphate-sugar epimerase
MRPNDGRVVSNFIVQASSGQPLTIYGEGNQTRSFCYVDDTVEGIIQLLLKESDRSLDERTDRKSFLYRSPTQARQSSVHEPVNIGNPEELTVNQLAQVITRLTGSNAEVRHEPLPIDDPQVRRPDITKAQTLLGWSPKFAIEEGLARTIQYFSTKLHSYVPSRV